MMKRAMTAAAMAVCLAAGPATAEILAIMNYESKPADQLKSLKLSGDAPRREGLAIVDVDPESPNFGRIVSDIPIDPATVAHHIFYDRTMRRPTSPACNSPRFRFWISPRIPTVYPRSRRRPARWARTSSSMRRTSAGI
jgi:hypothetical protein